MSKLAIVAPGAQELEALISWQLPHLEIAIVPPDPAAARAAIREADVMLAWKLPPGLLAGARRLRWIQSFGAGVDHLTSEEVPPGVVITRLVGVFGRAMAEFVAGFCYATTLDVRRLLEQQQRAEWKPMTAPLLRGKTTVVVGLGEIGREICRLLAANGLRVLGVSRTGRPVDGVEQSYAVDDIERVLPEADYLVLVLPLTPATRGLLDARKLSLLPRGAWLVNVARGAVVVEDDLIAALQHGPLAGAVLDVFAQEPLPASHPFWSMENVYVTPHMSGPDDNEFVASQFVENYRRFEAGLPLLRTVDLQLGY